MSTFSHLSQLNAALAKQESSSGSIMKLATIVGLSAGLVSTGLYYLLQRMNESAAQNYDQMTLLKQELIKELRALPIDPPKDADFIFTRDFTILLFRLLYTYQTIGREVYKEQVFEKRIQQLKVNDVAGYQETLDARAKGFQLVQLEMKEIIFDYFNIITKEYEMAYEKFKGDKEYQEKITAFKEQVDADFVDKKWEDLPPGLTIEKTRAIIIRKQELVNSALMRMIQGQTPNAQGQVTIGQRELAFELAKFDDDTFIHEGFRKEHIDQAIRIYHLENEGREEPTSQEEEENLRTFSRGVGAVPESTSRPTGKQINLD